MKSLLLRAACAAALMLPAAAQAGEEHQHAGCLDEICSMEALFQSGAAAGASTGAPAEFTGTDALRLGTWGFDIAGMDRSVSPGDDFFRYANGLYLDATEIPSDRTRWGSFDMLAQLSENRLQTLIHDISAGQHAEGSDEAKIAALYTSFLDEARVNALGAQPLMPLIEQIRAADTREALAAYQGRTAGGFGRSLTGTAVFGDSRNPDVYAAYLFQGGIGLPDRDYYLSDRYAEQKAAYEAYVGRILSLIGWDNPAEAAADIVAYETRLAEAQWTRVESRDRDKTYNPMTRAELVAQAPGFDWEAFFDAASLDHVDRFVVTQNTAFPRLAAIYAETPVETLQAWQAFHTADQAAPYLSQDFVDANWEFRSRTLAGQPEPRSREKRAIAFADGAMGEALGRLYVARWFPPESKAQMETLVANLREAMANRIRGLEWMSDETKQRALEKLEKFGVKIGYPDRWRDYSPLEVRADDLFGNQTRSMAYEWERQAARVGQPIDEVEWGMTPQTVNAYYSPVQNEIVFPAAILQPPFFDPEADPAVNYGGIGGVIGHEIGHGFDDQGRKSNGDGLLQEWWTEEDEARFEAQAQRLGAQFDAYEPLPGYNVQGGLTMGENIGDLAGVTLALEGYRISLDGRDSPVLDGFTGDQRVMLGWAQVWRGKYRDAAMQQMVATNPHSPPQFRVIGPLRNIDAWYEAFGVQPGERYYVPPAERVRIW
ncbi:M13-type metalloendopeptidase [Brevundimonas sp. 2R-24]|uniref:M13-type metalloendopeptidase n=1 Tax=Peiella sedimenti TaxID=3061083 RepID=A0ABT8SKU0_9CAUL|nr:M13-type metalloendopeptidase [Caulobacteraceae bacterium XZ-24]